MRQRGEARAIAREEVVRVWIGWKREQSVINVAIAQSSPSLSLSSSLTRKIQLLDRSRGRRTLSRDLYA